ncbi:MAG: hypothetical protein ACRC62_06055, partial [Microcoleus sp.]
AWEFFVSLTRLLIHLLLASVKMSIPLSILELVAQLTSEIDLLEQQASEGLVLARQLLDRFPNNATLIGLSANLGNIIFFASSLRNRIENLIASISGSNVSIDAIQEVGEELSEFWGRVLECKMALSRSVNILEGLQ